MLPHRTRGMPVLAGCLVVCMLLVPLAAALAQSSAVASLTPPDTQSFPTIETYLKVRDAGGKFVTGLDASSVQIMEDGQPAPLDAIEEQHPGVQLVVALNPGPAFDVHNSQGVSRLEIIQGYLRLWAQSRLGSSLDDLSLLVTGVEIGKIHLSDPQDWLEQLNSIAIDARNATPSLDILLQAVDLAADQPPRAGMGRAVLYITPAPDRQIAQAIENVRTLAREQDVAINIWLVAPAGAPLSAASQMLQQLAVDTGGSLLSLSGEEAMPDLEAMLEPLRSIYALRYSAVARGNGTHAVYASVQVDGQAITTTTRSYSILLQPPDPAFISPALEILRQPPQALNGDQKPYEVPVEQLAPAAQDLQVLIDFPDGRVRPLAATRLYVDGQVVAENQAPPFDHFRWDLSRYAESGEHLLKVEAVDSFGFSGSSMETAVQVNVSRPGPTLVETVSSHATALTALGIVILGAVVLLALVLGGRIQPYADLIRKQRQARKRRLPKEDRGKEEVPHPRPGWVDRLQWPQKHALPQAVAYLSRIADPAHQPTTPPIPIRADEVTLGSDPNQATLVLNDPSVDGLHARLKHLEDGSFLLTDEGSVAGAWVNYAPVPPGGTRLEHGDIVHIGRSEFRFNLRKPVNPRKPVAIPINVERERAL